MLQAICLGKRNYIFFSNYHVSALILSCTKMKDAEESPHRAYNLYSVALYMDDDGDRIISLVLNDEGSEVRENDVTSDPDLIGIWWLTEYHFAL